LLASNRSCGSPANSHTAASETAWIKYRGKKCKEGGQHKGWNSFNLVIDYKKDDFEKALSGYDVVLNSQDGKTLEKSLQVLNPGGKLISISGPPDPAFADAIHAPWMVKQVMRMLSMGVLRRARRGNVDYAFLFMQANGSQLRQIAALVESGAIRPVLDRVFPFDSTNEAMAYVESGRAKGKVVIKLR
jgi:alcohol dehydrogenase